MNTQKEDFNELWNRAESTLLRKRLIVVCNAKGAVQAVENHGGFQFDMIAFFFFYCLHNCKRKRPEGAWATYWICIYPKQCLAFSKSI